MGQDIPCGIAEVEAARAQGDLARGAEGAAEVGVEAERTDVEVACGASRLGRAVGGGREAREAAQGGAGAETAPEGEAPCPGVSRIGARGPSPLSLREDAEVEGRQAEGCE